MRLQVCIKENLKSSANDSEHDKEESNEPDIDEDEDQLEEEQEEETGDMTIIKSFNKRAFQKTSNDKMFRYLRRSFSIITCSSKQIL